MSAVHVRRSGYALGARITGVDASQALNRETIEALRQAWLDHIVIHLPGQAISPSEFRDFCASFGELDVEYIRHVPRHPDLPQVVVRANQPANFKGGGTGKSPPGNKWHSDFSHMLRPSTLTFLLGKQIPSIGGDTMFTNLYMAYETLSPALKRMIEPLDAIHDVSRGASGRYARASPEEQAKMQALKPPVVHPLVRVHPETGRKALFVPERLDTIVGMTTDESRPLLDYLKGHATKYEFVYRHRWSVNDLIIWDNRCSLHNAVQDYGAEMRMLFRCALVGAESGRLYSDDASAMAVSVAATT